MPGRFTILRFLLGTLLLAAAGLKLYGLGVSPVPRVGWFAQPWVQLAAAEWELVLGVWLLSGAYPRAVWAATLATFLVFAGVSGYLGSVGVASCGCFGTIQASPWHAFAVDLAAVGLLALARPPRRATEPEAVPSGRWVIVAGPALLAGLIALGVSVWVGSASAGLGLLRGDALGVESSYLDYGEANPGAAVVREARLHNFTSRPVQVFGGTSDCSCMTTGELPVTIPPGGSVAIPITLRVPRSAEGLFTRTAEVWTDAAGQPKVRFVIGCRVVPSAGGESAGP